MDLIGFVCVLESKGLSHALGRKVCVIKV